MSGMIEGAGVRGDEVRGRFPCRRSKIMTLVRHTLKGAERDGRASFGYVDAGSGLPTVAARDNLRVTSRRVVDSMESQLQAAYLAGGTAGRAGADDEQLQHGFRNWWLHEEIVDWVEI